MIATRSYWLGLGSGLILSAMLTLIVSPHQGQVLKTQEPSSVQPAKQKATLSPEDTKQAAQPPAAQPPATQPPATQSPAAQPPATQSTVDQPPATQPTAAEPSQPSQEASSNSQTERIFVIPEGANAVQIADLLVAQGFIDNKQNFLESVYQMDVSSRFRSGTYSLAVGLSPEELIPKLLMK